MKDKISAVLFISLGIFFLVGALRMPRMTEYGKYGAPGIVPAFFSIMVILLCTIMLLRKKKATFTDSRISPEIRKVESQRLLLATAIFLIYVLLLGKINFIVLTSTFLSAISIVFFRKKFILLVLSSVGVTVGIYYLFARVFLLPLP
ncbi:tripartite tricarboxylate transporter TctB family protein [Pseudothermotoga sp.]|uniref:tripartite tricarboxylate transporter TctB family protein n=1 Tax=Pseudothermotoga sp. TaxID=2033661 RepID=UPI0031F63065